MLAQCSFYEKVTTLPLVLTSDEGKENSMILSSLMSALNIYVHL